MLEGLDAVPWADLEHAYGSAEDVPDLLRQLLDPDPKIRSGVLHHLYGNVFHQGTRYPATPYVIPFLIEMCASPDVADRDDLLRFWASLITGYFSVTERPCWGDGEFIHWFGEVQKVDPRDPYAVALHEIYRESLKGVGLLCQLLVDDEPDVRAGAARVLACLPTMAATTVPHLNAQLRTESSGWVRATIAFALGELGNSAALALMATEETFPAARCMVTCQLARLAPSPELVGPLIEFVSTPIEGYERVPGAGGKSTGDAAYAVSCLPQDVQLKAVPVICDRLEQARAFDTIPLVNTLLSAAFEPRKKLLKELTDLQRQILRRMVDTEELWSIGNLMDTFKYYGLPHDRKKCAKLVSVHVVEDPALAELRWALSYAEIEFLDEARRGILRAIELDPLVFERAPAPDECWLLCAKAFAETDAKRAVEAYHRARSMNPMVTGQIDPTWRLADLIQDE